MDGRRDPSRGCERVYVEWQADRRSTKATDLTIPEGHTE